MESRDVGTSEFVVSGRGATYTFIQTCQGPVEDCSVSRSGDPGSTARWKWLYSRKGSGPFIAASAGQRGERTKVQCGVPD